MGALYSGFLGLSLALCVHTVFTAWKECKYSETLIHLRGLPDSDLEEMQALILDPEVFEIAKEYSVDALITHEQTQYLVVVRGPAEQRRRYLLVYR